ncbi:Zinc finger BED domain-containing protein RICESLEEPER 2 [Euphorbia peplus]|nr:Zinc finger BED domain-containing protein RICESLEEPER 2 [Euphorbia peplus]
MTITCHFIDDSWTLCSHLLRFIYVPSPHTKDELAQHLLEVLTKWNIETNISTITVVNCTTNDDGLSILDSAIVRIRESVSFWSSTPQRYEKFQDMGKQLKISCFKKLSLDCRTRWNSTYLMLKVALHYKDIFPKLRLRDKHYIDVPTDDDWIVASKIADKLEIFYTTTELCFGTKFPTSNCFFVAICQFRSSIVEWMGSSDNVIREMIQRMFHKFEKYWSSCHTILAMAVVLDPRYKMQVILYYYPMIYGEFSSYQIEKVKRSCYTLLSEYQLRTKKYQSDYSLGIPPVPLFDSQVLHTKEKYNLVAF